MPAGYLAVFGLEGVGQGRDTLFGTTPRYEDISWNGLEFNEADFERITAVDDEAWKQELASHAELFEKLRHGLPAQLREHCRRLMESLG